jgi:hypothetical protein
VAASKESEPEALAAFSSSSGLHIDVEEPTLVMDDDELGRAPSAAMDLDPETALDHELQHLERWARSIVWGGRFETALSVTLRLLALLGAGGAAAVGLMGHPDLVFPSCAVAALGISMHAALPRATALALHRRATCDIRDLESLLKTRWHKVRLAYPDPRAPKRVDHALYLLRLVEAHRKEIGRALGSAEPSSGIDR